VLLFVCFSGLVLFEVCGLNLNVNFLMYV